MESFATAVRRAGLDATVVVPLRPEARTVLAMRPRVTRGCAASGVTGADRRSTRADVGHVPSTAVVAQQVPVPATKGLTHPQATSVRAWSPPV